MGGNAIHCKKEESNKKAATIVADTMVRPVQSSSSRRQREEDLDILIFLFPVLLLV